MHSAFYPSSNSGDLKVNPHRSKHECCHIREIVYTTICFLPTPSITCPTERTFTGIQPHRDSTSCDILPKPPGASLFVCFPRYKERMAQKQAIQPWSLPFLYSTRTSCCISLFITAALLPFTSKCIYSIANRLYDSSEFKILTTLYLKNSPRGIQ